MPNEINIDELNNFNERLKTASQKLQNFEDEVPAINSELVSKYPGIRISVNSNPLFRASNRLFSQYYIRPKLPGQPQQESQEKQANKNTNKKQGTQILMVMADFAEVAVRAVLLKGVEH